MARRPKTAKQARAECVVRWTTPKAASEMRSPSLRDEAPSIWDTCRASGGLNGSDARASEASSINDCRTSAKQKPVIRVKAGVGITGGNVNLSMTGPPSKKEKSMRLNRHGRPYGGHGRWDS